MLPPATAKLSTNPAGDDERVGANAALLPKSDMDGEGLDIEPAEGRICAGSPTGCPTAPTALLLDQPDPECPDDVDC